MNPPNLTESEKTALIHVYNRSDHVYNMWWRKYHNASHVNRMFAYLRKKGRNDLLSDFCMCVAIVMHDFVYEPTEKDNEEKSFKALERMLEDLKKNTPGFQISEDKISHIHNMITVTGTPYTDKSALTEDERLLIEADWNGMMYWDTLDAEKIEFLDAWEDGIFKEYQMYPLMDYIRERGNFLKTAMDNGMITKAVYDYVRYRMVSKIYHVAVYAGTFSPFHKGHLSVLTQILPDYDKVIVARGINPEKEPGPTNIHEVFPHLQTVEFSNLLPDFLGSLENTNCRVTLVRGLRNGNDLTYETNIVKFLKDHLPSDSGIKTIWVPAEPRYDYISSTFVNGLPEGKRKRYLPKTPTY